MSLSLERIADLLHLPTIEGIQRRRKRKGLADLNDYVLQTGLDYFIVESAPPPYAEEMHEYIELMGREELPAEQFIGLHSHYGSLEYHMARKHLYVEMAGVLGFDGVDVHGIEDSYPSEEDVFVEETSEGVVEITSESYSRIRLSDVTEDMVTFLDWHSHPFLNAAPSEGDVDNFNQTLSMFEGVKGVHLLFAIYTPVTNKLHWYEAKRVWKGCTHRIFQPE